MGWGMSKGGRQVGGGGGVGGKGGKQRYGPTGRNGLKVLILVQRRPRAGAKASGKAIGWNRPPI